MQWTRQDAVQTSSERNKSRTRWLLPLRERIRATIKGYYADNPDGEKVTLAVFDEIQPSEIEALRQDLDAGRRELGLRVPIELVALYGEHRVETWRKGRRAAPRPTRRDWPRNYTPHRVRFDTEGVEVQHAHRFTRSFEDRELWGAVFQSWFRVLGDYREAGDDLGWWHNEPANVSLLAGAIWRLDGEPRPVCISEFSVSRRGRPRWGRGDLWFRLGGLTVDIEAKIVWPRTDGDRAGVLTVTQLEEAAWQLSSAEGARADRRFAVCFVVPAVPVDAEDNTGAVLADLEAELLEGQTAIARFSLSHDPVAQTNSDGFSYPAVMMVVRRVD